MASKNTKTRGLRRTPHPPKSKEALKNYQENNIKK